VNLNTIINNLINQLNNIEHSNPDAQKAKEKLLKQLNINNIPTSKEQLEILQQLQNIINNLAK